MNGPGSASPFRWDSLLPTGALLLDVVLFSTTTSYSELVGLAIACGGVLVAAAMLYAHIGPFPAIAPWVVIATFVVLAGAAPSTPTTDLIGGMGGLALLLWIATEPGRGPRAVLRSLSALASTGLIVLIAWTSALVLPRSPALLGVGGALLVAVVIAVAILLGRPDLIDPDRSATA